tara:strand:- start:925 stop:1137 length:213 start_codon:yes stop_codon:yes gene_type:complete
MLWLSFRIGAFVLSLLLILLGIVGLFLPFLQGFLLIALGLSVLSLVPPGVAGWVKRLKERGRDMWERYRG